MTRLFKLFLVAALAVMMTACGLFGGGEKKVEVDPLLLVGRWEAPSQARGAAEDAKLVFVFSADGCVVAGDNYGKWGYQFDQGDFDKEEWSYIEPQLLSQDPEGDYHKNGWFGWETRPGEIQLWNTTSVGNAVVPYTCEVKAFSSTSMTMVDAGKTYVFKKVK